MRSRPFILLALAAVLHSAPLHAQKSGEGIDLSNFYDSAHHWYDINDEVPKVIAPLPDQKKYQEHQIGEIAENILLYQRSNGGWPKNYDMTAVLTEEQRRTLAATQADISLTTFDNGATHSQIDYLARAFQKVPDVRYKDAALRGIDFILSAQYPNGGFPQFYPDTIGYRKYITFNDGAMPGVMNVLGRISNGEPYFAFVDLPLRERVRIAYLKGIDCILKCQIRVNDTLTAWCQQHDHRDLSPQNARTFEPKAICSMESAEIVLAMMSMENPDAAVKEAVHSAVTWFLRSRILGMRVETVKAKKEKFIYHTSDDDRVVVRDPSAPPMWARLYDVATNRPILCRRDGTIVFTLAEVERERRTGYKWYCYEPAEVIERYASWQKQWSPDRSVME